MVTDDRQEPETRRPGGPRVAGERPGRRALFTPATPPTRKASVPRPPPAAAGEPTAPPVSVPDPAVLADAIERGIRDRAPVDPGSVDDTFGPVVTVVNRLLQEIHGTRPRAEGAWTPRTPVSLHDLPLPALFAGRDLGLIDANEPFQRLSGLTREGVAGTPISRFVRRRDGDPPILALRREEPTRARVSLDTVDGEAVCIEHASPVRNEAGEIVGLIVVYMPEPVVGEPVENGYARLFEALMQEATLPIALLDASFHVVNHTPAFATLIGVDETWLGDHPLTDLPLIEERGPALAEIADLGDEAFGEVLIEIDGVRRRLERYVLPVRDAGGRLFRLLITLVDRTESDIKADRIARLEEQAALLSEEDRERVEAIEQAFLRLSEGNLEHRLELPPGDRYASLASSYNRAIERLRERIAALEARAEATTAGPPPGPDPTMMISAAEITGLLLRALAGERGDRLLLDEADPFMPLRAEVNDALDRLEAAPVPREDLEETETRMPVATLVEPPPEQPERFGESPVGPGPEEPVPLEREAKREILPIPAKESLEPEAIPVSVSNIRPSPSPSPGESTAPPVVPSSSPEVEDLPGAVLDPGAHVEVVIFEMAGQQYALDIHLAREIVEMMPITPIPRSPPHITGIINLRGEITTILNLYRLLGLPDPGTEVGQKIVVLVPEAAEGSNVGIIVDNVHSVNQIPAHRIELKGKGSSADYTGFVRGIIRQERVEGEEGHKNLVIWIDMPAILQGLIAQSS